MNLVAVATMIEIVIFKSKVEVIAVVAAAIVTEILFKK
jgi:hypothetical protein